MKNNNPTDFIELLKNLGPIQTTHKARKEAPLQSLIEDADSWKKSPGNLGCIEDIKKRFEDLGSEDQTAFSKLMRGGPVQDNDPKQYNILDCLLLSTDKVTDRKPWIKLVKWAIEKIGCSPNRFNGDNVPVGSAGYTGQAGMLKVFHKAGADLVLCLSEAHAGDNPSLVGTTLLQRMAQRPFLFDKYDMEGAVDYLVVHTPRSLEPDARGFNALTDPQVTDEVKTIVQTACSRKEARARSTKARDAKNLPLPRPRQRP